MKDPCLPVGYCFPASIPLFMHDYNIHTIPSYIPRWLPLTAVLIVYRAIFEHMQYSPIDFIMVPLIITMVFQTLAQYHGHTTTSLQVGLPASITYNKNIFRSVGGPYVVQLAKYLCFPKMSATKPPTVSSADRTQYSLPSTSVLQIWQPPNHPRFRQ